MILDEQLEFADAVSVANAADRILVGDVIDLGVGSRDPGNGEPMYLVITTAVEIITAGVAGTIAFELVSDATSTVDPDTSTVHFRTAEFVTDDTALIDDELRAGGVIAVVALPMEGVPYERWLGIVADIGTTEVTAGSINAFLTHDVARWKAYADGPEAINPGA
jgi:hypothetical protein